MSLPRGWKTSVLKGIGAPVNQNNLALLRAWQQAEGGGTANNANYNPLNTTQPAQGAGSINSVGVRSYRTASQGIQATVKTLLNGHYGNVVGALRQGASPAVTAHAIAQSPWGTGSGVLRVLGHGGAPVTPAAAELLNQPAPRGPGIPGYSYQVSKPVDLTKTLNQNLSNIAMGEKPTDMLASLVQAASMPNYATVHVPGTPGARTPAAPHDLPLGSSVNLNPRGGQWGGTLAPATSLAQVGENMGLQVTSTKRDRKMTTSGNQSDHWTGSRNAYAYDLSGSQAEMDKAAIRMAAQLGVKYDGKSELVLTKVINGLRYQLLYHTQVGGNHETHIHAGVRRL